MNRILLLTMTALFVEAPICFAQKPTEPPAPDAPASRGASRRSMTLGSANTPGGLASGTTLFSNSKGDSIPPVMIRFSPPDAKTSAGLEEDLFVMARVISRTLERAEGDKVSYKLGVPMLLTGSGRSVRPMYIEGLGPLFMIKVSFPLLPPPKPEAKTARKAEVNTEWDEAHRDVFATPDAWAEDSDRASNSNEEPVELLKRELLGALKNATHMRGLKPDEFVNIAVFGHAPPVRIKSISYPASGEVGIGLPAASVAYEKGGAANAAKGSVLTLRAKKSDIDSFATGKLDAAAFKAKVTMTTYAGSGIGITSLNSWIQEGSSRYRP